MNMKHCCWAPHLHSVFQVNALRSRWSSNSWKTVFRKGKVSQFYRPCNVCECLTHTGLGRGQSCSTAAQFISREKGEHHSCQIPDWTHLLWASPHLMDLTLVNPMKYLGLTTFYGLFQPFSPWLKSCELLKGAFHGAAITGERGRMVPAPMGAASSGCVWMLTALAAGQGQKCLSSLCPVHAGGIPGAKEPPYQITTSAWENKWLEVIYKRKVCLSQFLKKNSLVWAAPWCDF